MPESCSASTKVTSVENNYSAMAMRNPECWMIVLRGRRRRNVDTKCQDEKTKEATKDERQRAENTKEQTRDETEDRRRQDK